MVDHEQEARERLEERKSDKKWDFLKNIKLVHVFLVGFFIILMYQYTLYNEPTKAQLTINGTMIEKPESLQDSLSKLMPVIVIGTLFLLFLKGQKQEGNRLLTRREAEHILKEEITEIRREEVYSGFPSGELVITKLGKLTKQKQGYVWWIPYMIREKFLGIGVEKEHWYIGKIDAERGLNYLGSVIPTDKNGNKIVPTGKEGGPDFDEHYYMPRELQDYMDAGARS